MQLMFSLQVHQQEVAKQKLFNYLWNTAASGQQGRTSSNVPGSTSQRMIPTARKQMERLSTPPVTNTLETD